MINFLHVLTWAAFVVALLFLINAWRLHHKVRQQLKELETAPVTPTNVRVVQPDCFEDPVELVYPDRGVDGIHDWVAVPTSPFLTPDDDVIGEVRPRDIARRVMVVTPVAAVMAALDRKWPDWPGWRDRRRGAIRDAMYAELLGAFKAVRADFREYRRTHP
jgi:hypothetical protein